MPWSERHADYLERQIVRLKGEIANTSDIIAREVFRECLNALERLRKPVDAISATPKRVKGMPTRECERCGWGFSFETARPDGSETNYITTKDGIVGVKTLTKTLCIGCYTFEKHRKPR